MTRGDKHGHIIRISITQAVAQSWQQLLKIKQVAKEGNLIACVLIDQLVIRRTRELTALLLQAHREREQHTRVARAPLLEMSILDIKPVGRYET